MAKRMFTLSFLQKYWGSGESFIFRGKKYRVGRMNYGAYFFEPFNWKGGETEGFPKGTIWLKKSEKYPNSLYEIDNEGDLFR